MVERHLKFMKGLVRQRAYVEGSMMEGYMVYQNMLYVSEYLPILASKLNLHRICDPDSKNDFEGEYPKGKGRSRKVKGNITHLTIDFYVYISYIFYFYIQYIASIKSVYFVK